MELDLKKKFILIENLNFLNLFFLVDNKTLTKFKFIFKIDFYLFLNLSQIKQLIND